MTWDINSPLGTEPANTADDEFRELKTDLQSAFRAADTDGVVAVFPGSDLANPVYEYRGRKGTTGARPTAGENGLYIDITRNVMQRDNGSTWDDVATLIPAGTVMLFFQAAAPVGWTKVTTQNDKALRIVSGSGGGAGGSVGLSAGINLAHSHTVNNHTHTIAHRHITPVSTSGGGISVAEGVAWGQGVSAQVITHYSPGGGAFGGSIDCIKTTPEDTANSGGATPGTDSQLSNITLAYADVIAASKD